MAESKTVSVRGGAFHVKVWSAGSGSPLVFLHGFAGINAWPDWLDTLTGHHTIFAPQLPGYSESTGIEIIDDFLDLVIYHHDLFDALGIDGPVTIIGHSLGGAIAAELAAISPAVVDKLVLVDAMGFWDDAHPVADVFATTDKDLLELSWGDPEAAQARGLAPKPETEAEKQLAVIDRAQSLSTAGKFLWPIPDKGLKRRIHRIKAPTLLIWGAEDKVVPPFYGKLFEDRIAGAKLVTIPGAGHSPQLEQPEAFLDALAKMPG